MIAFVVLPSTRRSNGAVRGIQPTGYEKLMVVFISGISAPATLPHEKVIGQGETPEPLRSGGLVFKYSCGDCNGGAREESEFLMGPAVFAAVVASSMMFLGCYLRLR